MGEITVADLPDKIIASIDMNQHAEDNCGLPEEGMDLNKTVDDFEKNLLSKALQKSLGVKSNAAKLLNINRTTLVEKLKRFNMTKA